MKAGVSRDGEKLPQQLSGLALLKPSFEALKDGKVPILLHDVPLLTQAIDIEISRKWAFKIVGK